MKKYKISKKPLYVNQKEIKDLLITDLISIMLKPFSEHINSLITISTLERTILKVIDFTECILIFY